MRSFLITLLVCAAVCLHAQPKIENNQLVLENPVTFKAGTSELTDEGKEALKPVKDFLAGKEYVRLLRVEGHTDNGGNEHEAQKLTEQRALAICRWLVANGIDCKRLIAVGFGSTKPVESNSTPAGKAANRRIVFALAALKGRMIGGMPSDGGGAVAGDPCKVE
jgi:OmpA-OmpF porin, OOP family